MPEIDLAQPRHAESTFVDVDLVEEEMEGLEFDKCEFRSVRFNCSVQTDVAYLNCTFVNCSFFDATLTRCKMLGSTFERCTFDITEVDGGDWSFVKLARADLGSATFRGVRMREADLTEVRGEGGTLRDCDLSGATFTGADLARADLRGSDISSLDPGEVALRHAVITAEQAVMLALSQGLDVREA
jgi:fluoroquinolone resistance protein